MTREAVPRRGGSAARDPWSAGAGAGGAAVTRPIGLDCARLAVIEGGPS